MSDFLTNLRFPGGLDEGDLLAWIEGEALSGSKRAAVASWLAREPELAAQIEAMRSDRALLRAMGEVAAPAGLLDAVAGQLEPVLERQMLLGLAEGKDLVDGPPVSVVRPNRPGILASIFADRAGRRIAMAAGLLLLVGGSTYFLAQSLTSTPRFTKPSHTLALRQEDPEFPPQDPVEAAAPAAPAAAMAKSEPEAMPAVPAPLEAEAPETGMRMALADSTGEPELEPIGALPPPKMGPFPIIEGVDAVRAAELAAQGRLVIRVKADETMLVRNPDRVALRLRKAPPVDRVGWNVEGEAPESLASAVAEPFPQEAPMRLRRPRRPIIAGVADPDRYPDVPEGLLYGPALPQLSEALAHGPKVFSVQARLEPTNLSKLKDTLEGVGGEVVFEAADEPLPEVGAPALSPQAILWWGQRPEGWARWGRIPVVVDVQR